MSDISTPSDENAQSVAAGFKLHERTSPLTKPWAPIYRKADDRSVHLGVYLRGGHCNSRGLVHGGFIALWQITQWDTLPGKPCEAMGGTSRAL